MNRAAENDASHSRARSGNDLARAGDEAPVPFRGGGYAPRAIPFVGPATIALVLLLWWAATAFGATGRIGVAGPGETASALIAMARSGELALHLFASLRRLVVGVALGASCGLLVGFAIGLWSFARSSALPLVSALFPVPKIALLPLFIIWFGIGEASKIATIAIGVFSPMAIAAFGGVDGVDRGLIRMAQSFGVPPAAIVRKIVLPGALPALFSGLRIAALIGVVLLTAAEMIGAQHGVGALVLAAGNLMQTDRLLAGVVLLSLMGLAISHLIGLGEAAMLRRR